jgi:diguanylate cyclase (GGDEF)-like protein/PAS domain S-box-containing protein
MNKLNAQTKTLSILASLVLVSLVSVFIYLNALSSQQNQEWLDHTQLEMKRAETIRDIIANIGYGGFIHNFKNAILRKDLSKIDLAQLQILRAKEEMKRYGKYYHHEAVLLARIEKTLDEYWEKANLAKQLIEQGLSAEEIDQRVKVSDSEALVSMSRLITSAQEASKSLSELSIRRKADFSRALMLTVSGSALGIILSFLYIIFITNKNYIQIRRNAILFDLAPAAILTVDEKGLILSANKQAIETFCLDPDAFTSVCVDQLVPGPSRAAHRAQREAFHSSSQTMKMSDRTSTLQAVRMNGEVFPVSISIASHSENEQKEAIVIVKDLTEELDQLKQANTDNLTKLANRRAINEALNKAVQRAKRQASELYLAFIDIDHFKNLNDKFGHTFGDKVLVDVANYLSESVRETDFIGRWGGEEFLLLLEDSSASGALEICEKIRQHIERESILKACPFTVSIGLSRYRPNEDLKAFFDRSDSALYSSKESGRNRTTLN